MDDDRRTTSANVNVCARRKCESKKPWALQSTTRINESKDMRFGLTVRRGKWGVRAQYVEYKEERNMLQVNRLRPYGSGHYPDINFPLVFKARNVNLALARGNRGLYVDPSSKDNGIVVIILDGGSKNACIDRFVQIEHQPRDESHGYARVHSQN